MNTYKKRIERILQILLKKRLDGLLVTNLVNVQYLTGFTGSSADMLITSNQVYFITDSRYFEQAENELANTEMLSSAISIVKETKGLVKTLKKLLTGEIRLAVEADNLTYEQYQTLTKSLPKIKLVPSSGIVARLRQIKDDEEIGCIEKACEIAQMSFNELLPQIQVGVTEQDLALELEYLIKKRQADTAFEIIVLSGSRTSLPHGKASCKKLENDDLVLIDFGARYNGYNCDITRTLILGEKPTQKQQLIYQTVKQAQEEAILLLQNGVKSSVIDKKARDIIAQKGFGKYFGHSLGHSVGREIHERPAVSSKSNVTLTSGMVITIEPGIYLPGFGGVRIEDTVLITQEGVQILTNKINRIFS